jgi:hypothetical protein
MDSTTAAGLLLGVALLLIFGAVTSVTLWLANRVYKYFGGK